MAEVKWIKVYVDMFNKKKIKKIRRLPDGDKILLIWIMLLAQAGICNAGGCIFLTPSIPYTPDDLADDLGFTTDTVKLALEVFKKFEMLDVDTNGYILITNWEEYQQEDKLQSIREYNRIAKQKQRQKQKEKLLLCQGQNQGQNNDSQDIDIKIEKDIDIELNKDINKDNIKPTDYITEFFNLYNSIANRLPKATKLTESRKKKIKTRLSEMNIEDWKKVFEKLEASDFCCGNNDRNWKASFDWLLANDTNAIKVIEGKYDNRKGFNNSNSSLEELQQKGMEIL